MAPDEKYLCLRKILGRVVSEKYLLGEFREDIELQKDLNIDSAMLVDIVLDMEEAYSISVPDQVLERLRTVGDLVELIPRTFPLQT
jgi:acyl carrier protein